VVNAFAAQTGARVVVVDVGVAADLDPADGLLARKVRAGTRDMTVEPAMTREEAVAALEVGIAVAAELDADILLTGDMGIANTTPSAALVCAFTGAAAADATGLGTGIDPERHRHKVRIVQRALDAHERRADDPIGALAAVGGLEHAAIAGFLLGAAARRTPVILDGVIAGSSALVAAALSPVAATHWIAGHRSSEPGHTIALAHLGLGPMIDLGLRLGEGTGAALALPLVQAAVRALREVATFDSAGVTEKA
jgi:nicotinate-nucleotide--dimethylbenzimidazole phosphoribosyltransferase